MGRYGGSAGPGLGRRRRGAGENGGEWIGQAAPTVHLLHDAEEDPRAGPRHDPLVQVPRRDVDLPSDRGRERAEVEELVTVFSADVGAQLRGGAGLTGRGVLPLALAKPILKGDN